jgi:hypothetical protein
MPVSLTSKRKLTPLASCAMVVHAYRDLTFFGEFYGVVHQVDEYLSEPHGSPISAVGTSVPTSNSSSSPLSCALINRQVGEMLHDILEYRNRLAQIASCPLRSCRKIENIVDNAEQILRRRIDFLDVLRCFG